MSISSRRPRMNAPRIFAASAAASLLASLLAGLLVASPAFAADSVDGKEAAPAEASPATEAKPTEAKPSEAKPAESKPADDAQPTRKKTKTSARKKGGAVTADSKNPQVTMETSMGSFVLELWPSKAPETVKNFLKYAEDGFYSGTIFHRVIDGFMIQGGGFTVEMKQKPTRAPVKNEASPETSNVRGTIAMARTNDPDSATAQFFINVKDNGSSLDRRGSMPGGYAVFGKVVSGMDVVDKIKATKTRSMGMHDDVPETPVVIKSVKRN